MKCPKCESENLRAIIHVQLYIDAEDKCNLTKEVMQNKSTEIWSCDHSKTSLVCPNCYYGCERLEF